MTRYVSSRAAGNRHLYYHCSNRTEEYLLMNLCRRVYLLPRVCAEPYAPCKECGVN